MLAIGAFDITRIEDLALREGVDLFPAFRKEVLDANLPWLAPDYFDPASHTFALPIQSWLVRGGGRTMLIDTGAGSGKFRPLYPRYDRLDTPFLARLAAAGVAPGDVDLVICTHLDLDHVGWNTRFLDGAWRPTFLNARYIFPRRDRDAQDPARGGARYPAGHQQIFIDSVQPVIESELSSLVEGDESIEPGVDLFPVPGHSPGQMAVRLRSQGAEAWCIGDVAHNPIQIAAPAWNTRFCKDQEAAARTRTVVLEGAAERRVALLGGHFAGRVTHAPRGYAFRPL